MDRPNGAGKTVLAEPYAEQKSMPYLAADRTSFVVESALDGRGLARRVDRTNEADRTHEAGYETRIAFVVLDSVDLCSALRAEVRPGHSVLEEDVRRRYTRSKTNFWTLCRPKVDRWHLLLNAEDGFVDVAAGTSTNTFVLDDEAFAVFHRDIPTGHG